ncbi:MAG: 50S ribosomal protein L4 [Gammaproteobacteria bacterium]|nr:50S ribosomal protein L4 [Gammaproteobacteria bacterium]MDJ0871762.1 50S ribosomal protein L4 [Gammaproteobacteria bacterium]
MELALTNSSGSAGSVEVSDAAFGVVFNESLIHQVVTAYLAGARAGTRAQKNRAAVRGGGAKPYRQKGTGRARAGTIRSPLWRGGGRAFPASPQRHEQKVNRKMYRAALRSIFSELARQERLVVMESFSVDAPKTRGLESQLKALDLTDVLIVVEQPEDNLSLAARNLHRVDVQAGAAVDPVSLLRHEKVLVTVPALKQIEERLS